MSAINICNIALGRLGARAIRSFTDDDKNARQCELAYNTYLGNLLSKFDWSFSLAYIELAQLDEDGTDELPYVFALPADCLRPREVRPRNLNAKWERVGPKIFTNADAVFLTYSKDITDTAVFPKYFEVALAAAVAHQISMPITQNTKIKKDAQDWEREALADALEADMNTGYTYRTHDEDPDNDTFVNPDGNLES